MVPLFLIVLLSTSLASVFKVKIVQPDELMYIQAGENISLTCTFSLISPMFWLRQTPGENPLTIASVVYTETVKIDEDLQKTRRFSAFKRENSFILNISNAEMSDSATYFCALADYSDIDLDSCTVVVLKGLYGTHIHQPVLGPVFMGDNITLQCSVLTKGCAGEHSVYWFRHGSGESHPGIIYTHGGSSDQCNKSSDTDSSTRSCVYNLPKNNLKPSDAGTYYCAVDTCGQILFSNRTNLEIIWKENSVVDPIILILTASNIISIAVVLLLCVKLHICYKKASVEDHSIYKSQTEDIDSLNYAALNFVHPLAPRRTKTKINCDQSVYAQVVT